MSRAVQSAQSRMEQVKSTTYNQIYAIYNDVPFNVPNLNGKGVVYVDNSVGDLLEIKIVVCWRNKGGRLYGEDSDLDGALDVGEDLDGNFELDSSVELLTWIFQK